jgi:hypothetical protein
MKSVRLALLACLPALASAAFAATAPAPESDPRISRGPAGQPRTTVDPNDVTALREKAERGNIIAQYNLGLAYAQGRQTAVDLPEAFVWLTLSSQGGSTGKALETLLSAMSSQQIAEGRRRLEELRRINPFLRPTTTTPTPAVAAGGNVPAPTVAPTVVPQAPATPSDEARNLYDQLEILAGEKRQLAAELAAARNQLEQLKSAPTSGAGANDSGNATSAPAQQAELAALRSQLNEAQAELSARTEAAERAMARARQIESIAAERGRALADAQAEVSAARAEAASRAAAASAAGNAQAALDRERSAHAETTRSLAETRARLALATTEASRAAARSEEQASVVERTAVQAAELAAVRQESGQLREEVATLRSQLQTAEAERAQLVSRVAPGAGNRPNGGRGTESGQK